MRLTGSDFKSLGPPPQGSSGFDTSAACHEKSGSAMAPLIGESMSRFNKQNFGQIIKNIEKQELNNEDIWISIGILEKMYDDDVGYIDQYFHTQYNSRNWDQLWQKINGYLIKKNFD